MKRSKLSMVDGETTGQLILEGIVAHVDERSSSTERKDSHGIITAMGQNMMSTHVTVLTEAGRRETIERNLMYDGSLPKDIEGHWVRIYEAQIVAGYGRRKVQDPTTDKNFSMPLTRIQVFDADTNIPYH